MSLTAEQQANANTIIEVGRRLGASDRDITIALMAASQESDLVNINYGDRDSIGLFQQRDAWAPAADRLNPTKAAYMFFTGGQQGQRGLLDFKQRDQLSLTRAAQAVQVSAFPDAYAKWQGRAEQLLGRAPTAPTGTSENTAATGGPAASRASIDPTSIGEVNKDPATAAAIGSQVMGEDLLGFNDFAALFPDAAANRPFTDPTGQSRRTDLISHAMSYIGTPYVWGGNSRQGVDCGGLIQQVYGNFGVNIDRLSADQARGGRRVAYSQLQPGDLLAWDNSSRNNGADHISIYAGNNQIIEAPRPGLAVRRRTLSQHEIETGMGVSYGI